VEAGGKPVPLPPLPELHADDLPGGSLHRKATDKDHGFMSRDHVRRLDLVEVEIERRPVFDPEAYALKDHEHPGPPNAHGHPELRSGIEDLKGTVGPIIRRLEAVESRPRIDPSSFAKKEHDHPPPKLQPHDHPSLVAMIEDSVKASERLVELISGLQQELGDLKKENGDLREEIVFTRELAEKAIEAKQKPREHGSMGGGRLHDTVNDRLAGFMSPQHLRWLETLIESHKDRNG
jgi:hypothetical protein